MFSFSLPHIFFFFFLVSFCPQSEDGNLVFNPGATLAVEIPAKLLIANASSVTSAAGGGSAAAAPAATIDVAEKMNMMFEQLAEMKGDLAAANGKIDALTTENEELKTKLDNNLNTLRSDIAELNSTIANDVAEQDDGTFLAGPSLCAMLSPQILALGGDPATPCVLPTELDLSDPPSWDLHNPFAWMTWAPILVGVKKVNFGIKIAEQKGLKSLAGLFPRLEEVEGGIEIDQNSDLISIDGAFPSLVKVGASIDIKNQPLLESLAGGFPALTSVGGSVAIYGNVKLVSVGTGDNKIFSSMAAQSIKSTLAFYSNGRDQGKTFCQSGKGTLCSLAASNSGVGGTYGAQKCCQ